MSEMSWRASSANSSSWISRIASVADEGFPSISTPPCFALPALINCSIARQRRGSSQSAIRPRSRPIPPLRPGLAMARRWRSPSIPNGRDQYPGTVNLLVTTVGAGATAGLADAVGAGTGAAATGIGASLRQFSTAYAHCSPPDSNPPVGPL